MDRERVAEEGVDIVLLITFKTTLDPVTRHEFFFFYF